MIAQQGYDEIASLLASMDPAKLISMKASPVLQKRVEELLEKNTEEGLTEEEKIEMEHYLIINRLLPDRDMQKNKPDRVDIRQILADQDFYP